MLSAARGGMSVNRLISILLLLIVGCFVTIIFRTEYCEALKLEKAMQLINSVESIDPDIINFFSRKTPSSVYRNDVSEIDLSEVDTNDMITCFATLSYTCFQKKILVFIDSLNKVDKINVFGGYISFLRVGKPYAQPPITEELLVSRGVDDRDSLSTLLGRVFDDFIENRIVRITVPGLNAKIEGGRSLLDKNHCFEFGLTDIPVEGKSENDSTTNSSGEAEGRLQTFDQSCARGDNGMMALSSALIMKMIMLFPTLLKVIAAKTFFGILMGILSVILSKMALLPLFLSPQKGYHHHHHHHGGGGSAASFRQSHPQISTTTTTPIPTLITADHYPGYYPPIEHGMLAGHLGSSAIGAGGPLGSSVIGAGGPLGSSVIGAGGPLGSSAIGAGGPLGSSAIGAGGSPFNGPTAIMEPTAPHMYDNVWGDNDIQDIDEDGNGHIVYSSIKRNGEIPSTPTGSSFSANIDNENNRNKFNYAGLEAYKSKKTYSTRPNAPIYSRNSESATPHSTMQTDQTTATVHQNLLTTSSDSSSWVPSNAIPGRMKRWFNWFQ